MLAWSPASWGVGGFLGPCRHCINAVYAARRLRARSSISGCLRCARATFPRRRLDEAESLLSAARPAVRGLPARAASRLRVRRAYLLRLRLLLLVLRLVGRAREALRGGDDRPAGPDARTAWSPRWPATTAICCSTSRRRASRCSASSPPRTWPRRPGPGASGRRSSSWAPRPAARSPQQYGRADLVAGEQRLRPRAGHPGLRGRAARAGQGRRAW